MPIPNWEARETWNKDVQVKLDTLQDIIDWCAKWETWGGKNEDWYTERGFGRVERYLQLAHHELRDMQYFTNESERKKWKRSLDLD